MNTILLYYSTIAAGSVLKLRHYKKGSDGTFEVKGYKSGAELI